MVFLDLLWIAVIIVFGVDIAGFFTSIKEIIIKWISKGKFIGRNIIIKPFECSLCMTFWSGLIYLIVIGHFSLIYLAYLCLLCAFTGIIKSAILLLGDIITKFINWVYKKLIL